MFKTYFECQGFRFLLDRQVGRSLGQPVDLKEHGVQTATRAYRGGESIDIVVMSLFHDMTETIVSKNHGEAAAGLLEAYLDQRSIWMLRNHEVFQGYYYFHHFGGNRDERLQFKDHEWYQDLADWCENYDQAGFDPGYPSLPFDFFIPMVEQVLAREPFWWDPKHPKRAAVTGIASEGSKAEL